MGSMRKSWCGISAVGLNQNARLLLSSSKKARI